MSDAKKRREKNEKGILLRERIRALIVQSNLSEREISLQMGKSGNYINELLNGSGLPSMESFFDLCDFFQISESHFFDYSNQLNAYNQEVLTELTRLLGDDFPYLLDFIKKLSPSDYQSLKKIMNIKR